MHHDPGMCKGFIRAGSGCAPNRKTRRDVSFCLRCGDEKNAPARATGKKGSRQISVRNLPALLCLADAIDAAVECKSYKEGNRQISCRNLPIVLVREAI